MKIQHSFKGEGRYCTQCDAPRKAHQEKHNRKRKEFLFLGIDGEGITEHHGPWPGKHRYTMLCTSDERGYHHYIIKNAKGLRTRQCLDFILSLPKNSKIFAYSFSYDLAKILEDVDDLVVDLLHTRLDPRLRHG